MVLVGALAFASPSFAQAGGPPSGGGASGGQAGAEEHPIVDSVKISGVTKFSADALLKTISLKAGDKLSRASLQTAGNEIAAEYQKKGGDAAVSPDITHPSDGHVVVELKVEENGKGGFHWPTGGGGGQGGPGGAPSGTPPSGTPPSK